jgi:site-specific recombinase XerD
MTSWSRKKKDAAPRGVRRHESGVWGIRFTCGAGHLHKEKIGARKGDAIRAYHARRARVHDEPGWCPLPERERARADAARPRLTFRQYADDYLQWAETHKRSWTRDRSRLTRQLAAFGDRKVDEITTPDVERFLDSLSVSGATANRHRDLLSAMFKRALRLGLVAKNPVTGIPKAKEAGGRITYLPPASPGRPAFEEEALRGALPSDLRPLFAVSMLTGLRWSEQIALEWRDVDMLAGSIGVGRSKNGYSRRVPMNSAVRRVLVEVGAQRARPNDPTERVFTMAYRTVARTFARSVARAQAALQDAGKDVSRLDGYTWHGNRHTFASRLVMAGVDPLTVKELGGWRTLAMVQRYAHLAPAHLASAVERLVTEPSIATVPADAVPAAR